MVFAGLTSVIAKLGLKNVSGDTGLVIRSSFVFLFTWMNVLAFNRVNDFGQLTKKDILFLGISAITTSLSWIYYYRAIKIGNVSEVALIDKGSIMITLLLSILFLNEEFTWKVGLGGMMILGGIIVLNIKN
jgi:bacterial/archaeal transporter family protein